MKNKRYYQCIGMSSSIAIMFLYPTAWAVQPMTEQTLAQQTGALNQALPTIIIQAQQDQGRPAAQRLQYNLSDHYLREIRINTILNGGLSAHQQQKKVMAVDAKVKRESAIKTHAQKPDYFMKYDFDNDNVHVTYTDDARIELTIR